MGCPMINLDNFLGNQKTLLIAPAGYGKTHTIVESLLKIPLSEKKQLVLTHTHAGVSSINEKLKKYRVPNNYIVETISSFTQRYVLAFNINDNIPNIKDSKDYYTFINNSAIKLFTNKIIIDVIKSTYSGLFVDEYQDCTRKQHDLILILSQSLPTRLLGDFLQGIFEFNEATVDLTCSLEMDGFIQNYFELKEPQRWLNGNNAKLGNDLQIIRQKLLNKEPINLDSLKSIEVYQYPASDLYIPRTDYNKLIWKLLESSDSFLVIHSNTTSVEPRKKITQIFNRSLHLLESIDDKLFYKIAGLLDSANQGNIIPILHQISLLLFNKTEVNKWFNESGFKRKTKSDDKIMIDELAEFIQDYKINLHKILTAISAFPNFKSYRPEVLSSILKVIEIANSDKMTYYDSMTDYRNSIRRYGRKIDGKCIGTTLLTKGLEFDTVLVLDAHLFSCSKHFYVAVTRACKRLVVVSEKNVLTFK